MNTSKNPNPQLMTIQELIVDPTFIKNVKSILNDLRLQRSSRPSAGVGYRYKRDWYDKLSEAQNFNSEYFIVNIEAIWLKQSSLSSSIRGVIEYVCGQALQATLEHYAAQAADKEVITE